MLLPLRLGGDELWLFIVNAYAQATANSPAPDTTTEVYVKAVVLVVTTLSLIGNIQNYMKDKGENTDVRRIEQRMAALEQRFKEYEKSDQQHREALARELGEASVALRAAIFDRGGPKGKSM